MSARQIILGVDERIDEHGEQQPWRMVLMGAPIPGGRLQYLMALPGDRSYVSPPRHPLYGDLTRLGDRAAEQIGRVVDQIKALNVVDVHLEETHSSGTIGRTLIWNGIEPRGHVVPMQYQRDPFSIGGDAGSQIAYIELRLRSGT